jgi:anti-sigma-K factor RskA
MKHRRIERLIQDHVAGDLDEAAAREVERLIESDARARSLFEQARDAHEALTTLRERPDPPVTAREALPSIQSAIANAQFEPRPKLDLEGMGSRYYRRVALAASILFAVTAGVLVATGTFGDAPAPIVEPAGEPASVKADPGELGKEVSAYELLERMKREGRTRLPRLIPVDNVNWVPAAERR